MAEASLLLGILGNILSILVFSSPLRTFWKIFKRKSTENFKGLPYVCTLLSTSLWSYYGLIKPGGTLILTINAAGVIFQSFYLTIFLIYAPKQRKKRTALLALILNGVCFGVILVATLLSTKGSKQVFTVGAICSAISISMYASPLVALRSVFRTKSVEFMPFFLSLFLFLNGGVWSIYALLVKDIFIEIPNAIGFVLGGVQLGLYAYYKKYGKPVTKDGESKENLDGEKTPFQDLEMGRSVSLPQHFALSNKQYSPSTMPKHQSLPTKIVKASSAKLNELLNFLEENDPTNITPRKKGHLAAECARRVLSQAHQDTGKWKQPHPVEETESGKGRTRSEAEEQEGERLRREEDKLEDKRHRAVCKFIGGRSLPKFPLLRSSLHQRLLLLLLTLQSLCGPFGACWHAWR